MADRTYVYYRVHPDDIDKLLSLKLRNIAPEWDYEIRHSGLNHVEECSWGGGEDWRTMAEAGIRFYAWCGPLVENGCIGSFSTGDGRLHEADQGQDGGYVVYLDMRVVTPDGNEAVTPEAQLARIKAWDNAWNQLQDEIEQAWKSALSCSVCGAPEGETHPSSCADYIEAHGHE